MKLCLILMTVTFTFSALASDLTQLRERLNLSESETSVLMNGKRASSEKNCRFNLTLSADNKNDLEARMDAETFKDAFGQHSSGISFYPGKVAPDGENKIDYTFKKDVIILKTKMDRKNDYDNTMTITIKHDQEGKIVSVKMKNKSSSFMDNLLNSVNAVTDFTSLTCEF